MPKLGVVTCQILELEMAHVLLNDPEVEEIWVLQDEFSEELTQILENTNLKPVHKLTKTCELASNETNRLVVLIRVMKLGLHSNIPTLRRGVAEAVREMSSFVDAVFLGYGLCGNALKDPQKLFKGISVPVSLPMENDDPVDDCVGLIIGGRDKYYSEQCLCAGTMFINSGFSRHWENMLFLDIPKKLKHKKEDILECLMGNYERTLLLPTEILSEDDLRENIKGFNEQFNLKMESRPGTMTLFKNAWEIAKINSTRIKEK